MANWGRGISAGLSGAGSGAAIGTALPGLGTGLGAAIGGGVGLIGGLLSGDDGSEQMRAMMEKAIAELDALGYPPDLSGPIIYQRLGEAGMLTPKMESVLNEELTKAVVYNEDPSNRSNMTSALNQIRAQTFGFTPEQAAQMRMAQQKANAAVQSNNAAIMQAQAQQGKAGAGDALAARLLGAQAGGQQLSNDALQIGANASEMQREALNQYLSGSDKLRQTDAQIGQFNVNAKNTAQKFAAQNSADVQQRNMDRLNAAQLAKYNIDNQRYESNINRENAEKLRQRNEIGNLWDRRLGLAKVKADVYTGQADKYGQMAQNSNQNFNNILQGVTSAAGAYAQAKNNQNNLEAYNNRTNVLSQNRAPASTTNWFNDDVAVPRNLQYNPLTGQFE